MTPRTIFSAICPTISELRRYARFFRYSDAVKLKLPIRDPIVIQIYSRELKRLINIRRKTTDLGVALQILESREYALEPHDQAKLIIDAGANIGISSLFFAKYFPKAHIHAIEPELENFKLLQLNCAGVSNIIPHRAALWPRHTSLSIKDNNAEKWAFACEEKPDSGDIRAITIADILSSEDANKIDLLKLDIEGAEQALFSNGNAEWLYAVKTLIIELHDRYVPGCSKAFYSAICARNFSQEISGENLVIRFLDGS